MFLSADYLEACALVRKGRAKETCDDAHDRFCYITLQRGVRMFPVTGVVAYLGNDREYVMYNAHRITLPPRVHQVRHRMPLCTVLFVRVNMAKKSRTSLLIIFFFFFFKMLQMAYPTNVHQEVFK